MKIINIIAILTACCFSSNLFAQKADAKELKRLLTSLKGYQTYSFDAEINAVLPNGKKQQAKMVISMDKPGKRLFYSNDDQTLLVTPDWAYQAYHRQKKASVFNVVKYNKQYKDALPEIQQIFAEDILSFYVDSVLLKIATISSVKKNGHVSTYKLSFPPESIIKEMSVVMNDQKSMPDMITLKTFQHTSSSSYDKSKGGMTVETICRNYRNTVAPEAFNTSRFFQIRGGKAYLIQHKNYQLTSIL